MGYPSNEPNAHEHLRAFVERILRMKEEAKAINDDIREIYAEAKATGFDKTVLGQVVSFIEKRSKDPEMVAERSALFDLYLSSFDGNVETGTDVATHVHEALPPHDADGVIQEMGDEGAHATDDAQNGPAAADHGGEEPGTLGSLPANTTTPNMPTSLDEHSVVKSAPLRPYCLNPGMCAGQGKVHCYSCERAHLNSVGMVA